MSRAGSDDSGVAVYPPLPVPKSGGRDSDVRIRKSAGNTGGGAGRAKWLLGGAAVGIAGVVLGFCARPVIAPDAQLGALADQLAAQVTATASAKAHAAELQTDLDAAAVKAKAAAAQIRDAEAAKSELASKASEAEQKAEQKAKDAADVETKLRATVEKSQGSVSTEGDEIHLQLVDKVLFNVGDDQLTPVGKAVLDKVATALRDLPDRQVWVQGHTDNQVSIVALPPPAKKPTRGPPPAPPGVRFQTTWELSAARALQVVHYLQDVAKIDPARLAALAFGQYRPLSRTVKALNRRIEIVLYPKRITAK